VSLQKRRPFSAICTMPERKVEQCRATGIHLSPLEFAYKLGLYIQIMQLAVIYYWLNLDGILFYIRIAVSGQVLVLFFLWICHCNR